MVDHTVVENQQGVPELIKKVGIFVINTAKTMLL